MHIPTKPKALAKRNWRHTLIAGAISITLGTMFAWLSTSSIETRELITETIVFSITFFAAQEIVFIRNEQHDLMERAGDIEGGVHEVRNSFELKGSIFNVISSALDHNDAILRESFSLAMGDFFRSVRISRTELAVSGDNISEYIYQRFWDILNAYQAIQKRAGVATKVYVSHSASLAVWDKNGVLAQKQADFVTNGGIIYRIIIRNKSSKDNDSRYKEIVQSMKSQNLHVHLLDLRAKDRPTEIHDYLIVTINGEKYVFVWEADWNSNSHFFGDIEASRLLIGEGEFDHFRYRWTRLLEVAEEYKDNQNISFDDWRIKI